MRIQRFEPRVRQTERQLLVSCERVSPSTVTYCITVCACRMRNMRHEIFYAAINRRRLYFIQYYFQSSAQLTLAWHSRKLADTGYSTLYCTLDFTTGQRTRAPSHCFMIPREAARNNQERTRFRVPNAFPPQGRVSRHSCISPARNHQGTQASIPSFPWSMFTRTLAYSSPIAAVLAVLCSPVSTF